MCSVALYYHYTLLKNCLRLGISTDTVNTKSTALELSLHLGPNKHGLVTYMQVNVYIGNTLSWLNGGWAFKTDVC